MAGLLVITEKGMSAGFRCAGFECVEAGGAEEAGALLASVFSQGKYGLVAIDDELLSGVAPALKRRLDKRGFPVIVRLNIPKTWREKGYGESHVARLIRRAIGYQIKIRR